MAGIKDRMLQLMQSEGLTNGEFAERLGISNSSLSHIFNGRNKASLEVVMRIVKAYPNVSYDWIIDGKETEAAVVAGSENLTDAGEVSGDGENRRENASEDVRNGLKEIVREQIRFIEKPQPKIVEIRVFYDDGRFETFKSEE